MKNKVRDILMPVVVLTLIAAVMAGLLGGTNLLTADRLAALAAKAETEAIAKVIEADTYEKKVVKTKAGAVPYYAALTDGVTVGYAFTVSQNGYGGAVSAVVGISAIGSVTAVEITDVSGETPGLGQNAKKASFTEQFVDKRSALSVVKTGASEKEVNAVTGATITSKAVTDAVNTALELYQTIKKEGE